NDKISSTSYLLKNDKLIPYTKYNGALIYSDDKSNILTYKKDIGAVLIYSSLKVDTIYLEKEKKIELNSIYFFNDEIYICTINGIYVVKNSRIIDHITTNEGLSSNSVQSIYIDKYKNLWCATENGLSVYDNNSKRWYIINASNGLLDNFIYWVFEDKRNSIWVGTPQGVNKIIDKERFLAAIKTSSNDLGKYIKNYTTIDGLGNLDCNQNGFLVDSKGRVWISTVDKINLYLEQFDRSLLTPPKVTLSKIEIDNEELNVDSIPVFSSGIDLITFYFAGNSFVDESSIKYKYFLEGYENDYSNPTYLAFAQYHNIPPGDYVFHLKAISKNGIESANEVIIKFKVKARFYQTLIFKSLVALMGFALVIHLTINYQKRKTRKKLEMLEREKLFSDQKRKLAEMTLEHERERMEKDKLETEMKLKRDFTAMLIHELRSPLSSINGYAKLIKEIGELNADQKNAIDLILKLDERMLNIVNQMLDLSKFEAGKMEIEKVNMDIISLIDETIDSFLPLLKSKNLSLVKSYHQKECWVNLDILKIMQVLTNIISNAIKFSPENGTITISTSIKDNYVCFSCADEGPGIKKEDINNVFDLYKQVQKGIKGTGLGLSISKLIIEAHNGKIYCESEEGKGATFSFCLPLN
ncbi:MAG: ATP-binding protein, partial [Spirochaetota bacterium]